MHQRRVKLRAGALPFLKMTNAPPDVGAAFGGDRSGRLLLVIESEQDH